MKFLAFTFTPRAPVSLKGRKFLRSMSYVLADTETCLSIAIPFVLRIFTTFEIKLDFISLSIISNKLGEWVS